MVDRHQAPRTILEPHSGRWSASGVRAILAAGTGVAQPTAPGEALVIALPSTASRSLVDYRLENLTGSSSGDAS